MEQELQKLDSRITIVSNPSRPGLYNVKLDGQDIIPCPEEIREEIDPTYFYVFPNGMQGRHKSHTEIVDTVTKILAMVKTEEGKELFFSRE